LAACELILTVARCWPRFRSPPAPLLRVRSELHVFEEGGHGFGLRLVRGKPAAAWPALFHAWGGRHGVFGPARS
jgi:hypothetical protein